MPTPNESVTTNQPAHAASEASSTADAALLKEFLSRNDAPCPVCGYNLRHQPGNSCPECGQPFRLQVGAAHLRFGQFLLFLTPMLMMAGLATGYAATIGIQLIRSAIPGLISHVPWAIWTIIAIGFAEGIVVFPLYRKRAGFFARPRRTRFILTTLSCALNVLILVAIISYNV